MLTRLQSASPCAISSRPTFHLACSEDNARLQGELERAAAEQASLSGSIERLEAEAAEAREASSSREESVRGALRRLCTEAARQERELTLQRLQAAAPRLGCLGVRRHGINVQEVSPALHLSWLVCSIKPCEMLCQSMAPAR